MENVTQTLSRYICASRYETLPPEVRHEGVRAFVNWVGCAAGGSQEAPVEHALAVLSEFNGAKAATVVGRGERLDALNATFINSMSSSALIFNDTHFATVAHPTSPVAAALLALAERQPLAGKDFLHALILGIEIQCRIGSILCAPPAECHIGLSMVGLVGGIGVAAAAGKAMGFDETTLATAIGLAANQSCGLRQAHTTMATHFTPGHTARCGLLAAILAARGYTCSDQMIEGPNGFAASFSQQPNFGAAVEELGQSFEILTLAYKPYPCGFVNHPIIDACLDVAKNHAFDPAQIERAEVTASPLAIQLMNRPEPANRDQAIGSLHHWVATSLIYKAAGIAQITEAVTHDPAVRSLRGKVVMTGDPRVGREAANVRVVLRDGRTLEADVLHCRGSIGRPLTDDDIAEKTNAQLLTVFPPAKADRILAQCWRTEDFPLVEPFCKQLAKD